MDRPQVVVFRYEHDASYRMVPANGVLGGPTPRGDFRLEFFVEAVPTPKEVHQQVSPEGVLEPPTPDTSETPTFTRRLMVGIMMPQEQVRSLCEWLQAKLKQLDDITPKREP